MQRPNYVFLALSMDVGFRKSQWGGSSIHFNRKSCILRWDLHAVFIGQNLVFSVSLPLCFSLGLGIWGVVDEGTKTKLLLSSRLKVMNIVSTWKYWLKYFNFLAKAWSLGSINSFDPPYFWLFSIFFRGYASAPKDHIPDCKTYNFSEIVLAFQ